MLAKAPPVGPPPPVVARLPEVVTALRPSNLRTLALYGFIDWFGSSRQASTGGALLNNVFMYAGKGTKIQ